MKGFPHDSPRRYVDPQALAGGKGEGLGTVKEILAASRHLLKPARSEHILTILRHPNYSV